MRGGAPHSSRPVRGIARHRKRHTRGRESHGTSLARADAGPVWQTVSSPSGFRVQVPNGRTAHATANPRSSLQVAILSAGDREHLSVYATPLRIPLSDLSLFVSIHVGEQTLGAATPASA